MEVINILKKPYYPRAPGKILLVLFIVFSLVMFQFVTAAEPYRGFPNSVTLKIDDLDDSGDLIYIGIDFAVFEEVDALSDPEDIDGDGKVFKAKEGKVKRILTTSTNITVELGDPTDYKKAVKHKLAIRTLYTPTGVNTGEIIIAEQSNGKDGWIEVPESEFILSYFAPIDIDNNPIIKHTDKWEENRIAYNQSKIVAGIIPIGTEIRFKNTFYSGEKLLLDIKVNETLEAVKVSLYETTAPGISALYTETLPESVSVPDPDVTGGAIYRGQMWDSAMINKWGNYTPKTLTVELTAIVSGAAVETIYHTITMDNKDQFYRIKKVY